MTEESRENLQHLTVFTTESDFQRAAAKVFGLGADSPRACLSDLGFVSNPADNNFGENPKVKYSRERENCKSIIGFTGTEEGTVLYRVESDFSDPVSGSKLPTKRISISGESGLDGSRVGKTKIEMSQLEDQTAVKISLEIGDEGIIDKVTVGIPQAGVDATSAMQGGRWFTGLNPEKTSELAKGFFGDTFIGKQLDYRGLAKTLISEPGIEPELKQFIMTPEASA
jgi:hypothetical protein